MSTETLKARAGDLICFTTGEYSDYRLNGHFVALENITAEHFQAAREDAERCSVSCNREWRAAMQPRTPRRILNHHPMFTPLR